MYIGEMRMSFLAQAERKLPLGQGWLAGAVKRDHGRGKEGNELERMAGPSRLASCPPCPA